MFPIVRYFKANSYEKFTFNRRQYNGDIRRDELFCCFYRKTNASRGPIYEWYYSYFFFQQKFGYMTFLGQTIMHRGIVSSEEPIHVTLPAGEEPHGVSILPHREDGASYSGVLTFTATEPVEIGFSHRLHVDNSTLSQLDAETLDDLLLGQQTNRTEKGLPGIIAVPSVIIPDYGTKPPYFSASLPFAASSVWLRTPHGEPFIAVYEVAADVVQPQAFVADIKNATSGMNMSDGLSQNTTTGNGNFSTAETSLDSMTESEKYDTTTARRRSGQCSDKCY